MMRVIEIAAFGGGEVLQEAERPRPEPRSGEVRIAIEAAAFNPVDFKLRRDGGVPLPAILGRDAAGVIDDVASDVDRRWIGKRVAVYLSGSRASNGAYAEYACIDHRFVAEIPASLTFQQACAVPVAALTAYEAIFDKARLAADDVVLITGAGGAVGHSATQFALRAGARVLATATRPESAAAIQSLGVPVDDILLTCRRTTRELQREVQRRAPYGVRAAVDLVGGEMKRLAFATIAAGGNIVSIVEEPTDFDLNLWDETTSALMLRSASFHFEQLGSIAAYGAPEDWSRYGQRLTTILDLLATNQLIAPPLHHLGEMSADVVRQAHSRLECGRANGKLLMTVRKQ